MIFNTITFFRKI